MGDTAQDVDFDIKYTKIFINNKWVDSISGAKFSTFNPTTGNLICEVQQALKEDVDAAVAAARKAFEIGSPWRMMSGQDRGLLLMKLADLVEEEKQSLVRLEVLDNGKPISDADEELDHVIDVFRYYAGWSDKVGGQVLPVDSHYFGFTRREAVGVCGQVVPWNYPLIMIAWKWGPALATGNTIVLKPSELTPLTALYMAHLTKIVGFPDGTINVVPGFGNVAGSVLSAHMDVDILAFTGSTKVGHMIMKASSESNLKRTCLELGGKSPLIIFPDADLDLAVRTAHEAIMENQGQSCCAGSRTFVHADIYDAFVDKSIAVMKSRRIGDPMLPETEQGPQISEGQLNRILKFVDNGEREGAKLRFGGQRINRCGYFMTPALFTDVEDSMELATEEIFGPIQCVLKFSSVDEVIERANNSTYGLGAGICTKDYDTALCVAASLRVGSVWINCYDVVFPQTPFGGYKMSGHGRELGEYALQEYTECKTVLMKLSQQIPN